MRLRTLLRILPPNRIQGAVEAHALPKASHESCSGFRILVGQITHLKGVTSPAQSTITQKTRGAVRGTLIAETAAMNGGKHLQALAMTCPSCGRLAVPPMTGSTLTIAWYACECGHFWSARIRDGRPMAGPSPNTYGHRPQP
jgi:hypothetical protein